MLLLGMSSYAGIKCLLTCRAERAVMGNLDMREVGFLVVGIFRAGIVLGQLLIEMFEGNSRMVNDDVIGS